MQAKRARFVFDEGRRSACSCDELFGLFLTDIRRPKHDAPLQITITGIVIVHDVKLASDREQDKSRDESISDRTRADEVGLLEIRF